MAAIAEPVIARRQLAGVVMLVTDRDAKPFVEAIGRTDIATDRPSRPITIRDILSRMSGLPIKSAVEEPTLDLVPLTIGARNDTPAPLLFQPGARCQYSNAGVNTAGRIIEAVSGMPWE